MHSPVALQVSVPLQALVSAQVVPVARVWVTPLVCIASAVQGFASSTLTGVPGAQLPEASQVSAPLQVFASAQLVPTATGGGTCGRSRHTVGWCTVCCRFAGAQGPK